MLYSTVMGISQSFDGVRFSVKLSWPTMAQLEAAKGEGSREYVAREWLENWRTLANLSPFLYQRLVYSAQQRRLPLATLVNEALTQYCSQLPGVPPHVKVA